MKRLAYWAGIAFFFIGMFLLVQWGVCFMIWQMNINSGNTPDYTPESCTIDTTRERFEWITQH